MGSINAKIQAWQASSAGQKRMKEYVQDKQRSGGTLANGQKVIGPEEMSAMAQDLINMIRARLPESISSVGSTLHATAPTRSGEDAYRVRISFDSNALFRESLETDEEYGNQYGGHTGPGIQNIVALFNNGYGKDQIGRVYGLWASHGVMTYNAASRVGIGFMQAAVAEFNAKYKGKCQVDVMLGSDYH